MTETSRIKAINEIKRKLDERDKLIQIKERLDIFEEEGRWEEERDTTAKCSTESNGFTRGESADEEEIDHDDRDPASGHDGG